MRQLKSVPVDDVIVIGKDGVMKVMKIADKMFVGHLYELLSFEGMSRKFTIWFIDGKSGRLYAKKFKIGGVTKDSIPCLRRILNLESFFAVHDSKKKW